MWAPGYEKASHIIVHDDKTSDVENIPERILNELIRRNLLGKREVNIQESVSVIVLREPVSAQSYLAHDLCIASSDQHYCGLVNKA